MCTHGFLTLSPCSAEVRLETSAFKLRVKFRRLVYIPRHEKWMRWFQILIEVLPKMCWHSGLEVSNSAHHRGEIQVYCTWRRTTKHILKIHEVWDLGFQASKSTPFLPWSVIKASSVLWQIWAPSCALTFCASALQGWDLSKAIFI